MRVPDFIQFTPTSVDPMEDDSDISVDGSEHEIYSRWQFDEQQNRHRNDEWRNDHRRRRNYSASSEERWQSEPYRADCAPSTVASCRSPLTRSRSSIDVAPKLPANTERRESLRRNKSCQPPKYPRRSLTKVSLIPSAA